MVAMKGGDEERQREAREALERVERDSETFASSSLGRAARRLGDHFSGRDADHPEDDRIEVWGKRIGRALGLVLLVYLIYALMQQLAH